MGIFDSEYVYQAFAHTQPLISDEDKQDTMLTFVHSALKHDEENIVGNMIAAYKAGLPGTAHSYFTYGKNNYYWGLPESSFTIFNIDEDDIKKVLGQNITIERLFVPITSTQVEAIKWLNNQSWYDVGKKENWIPDRYQGHAGTIDPLGFSATREIKQSKHWLTIKAKITWHGPVDQFAPKFWTVTTRISSSNQFKQGLWVIYSRPSGSRPPTLGQEWYWPTRYSYVSYYPSSDFPETPISSKPSRFYPISVFWRDQVTYHSNPQWNETLKKLLKKLSIDRDEIFDSFMDALRKSGAKQLELLDFFIGFFVRLDLTFNRSYKDPNVQYVFELLKQLYLVRGFGRDRFEQYLQEKEDAYNEWLNSSGSSGGGTGTGPGTGLGPFRNTSIGPGPGHPGGGEDNIGGSIPSGPRFVRPPEARMYVSEGNTPGVGGGFNFIFSWSLIERYDSLISHADAESKFVPFQPGNQRLGRWIRGIDYLPNDTKQYVSYLLVNAESKYIVNTPDGAQSARPEGGVWCPVSYDLLKNLPFRDQEAVLQDGLCSVVYTVTEQEIRWYQNTFWSGIIVIITFVLTAWMGQVGMVGVLQAIGLSALGSVALFFITAVIRFSVGFLVSMTGSILRLGQRGMFIIKLYAMIAMSGGLRQFLSDFQTFFSDLWLNVANLSIDTVAALASKVSQLFSHGRMVVSLIKNVTQDTEDYTQSLKDKREEVEDAYLGNASRKITDPHLELSRRLDTNMFEAPDEFLFRTTMVNPGALALSVPANYVDMALQLPRTIGTGVTIGVHV